MANARDLFNKMGSGSMPRLTPPKQVVAPVVPVDDEGDHKPGAFDAGKKGGAGAAKYRTAGGPSGTGGGGGGGSVPTSVRPKV